MDIIHNKDLKEFSITIDGYKAYVSYIISNNSLDIRHTIVPKEIGGRGIASSLVKTAYDYALQENMIPIATCSYAATWLKRHPEYNGCESKDFIDGSCAL